MRREKSGRRESERGVEVVMRRGRSGRETRGRFALRTGVDVERCDASMETGSRMCEGARRERFGGPAILLFLLFVVYCFPCCSMILLSIAFGVSFSFVRSEAYQ